jgi:2-dehydropantoate 2-reductase
MQTLVVGAGAIGGYFGGRLVEAKRDVTFLVRQRRAEELATSGLIIRSTFGDVTISQPKTILAENLRQTSDLILLSCKAFDLQGAMDSFSPAVGPTTVILPLLNGMRHLDALDQRFGASRVFGGQCLIGATVNEKHEVVHLNDVHDLSFGERDGSLSERVKAIGDLMEGVRFNARLSRQILLEMWEKWVFLASAASGTCLMRAAIGDICASPGGTDYMIGVLEECRRIATAEGYPIREESYKRSRDMLTASGSTLTASMLRDIERNGRIEADHIVGDLFERGKRHRISGPDSFLKVAYTHLKSFEARRARTASQT